MEVWDACNFLHSGLRVKIVDSWADGDDFDPKMDRWLGEVMTVKDIRYGGRVIMEEDAGECRRHFADDGHWFWHPSMIDRIVDDDEPDGDEDVADFLSILTQ